MKLGAGILVLLLVIFTFAYYTYNQTLNLAGELQALLKDWATMVEKERWKEAGEQAGVIEKKWEVTSNWWLPLMDHNEIELVEQAIARSAELVGIRSREMALVEIRMAQRLTQYIVESERPALKNIF
ncbi:MAG TPA: DUF4363 family protein [Firmicutes bacterium]|nr:DUF4363 family protein [Bacillota bacterium]